MEWKKFDLTDEHVKGGEFCTLVYISDREFLKVTNKLVKRRPDRSVYLLYKDGFTFDLYRVEYGRFGKRFDKWVRKADSSELEKLFECYTEEGEPSLPEVTGEPLEELLDE